MAVKHQETCTETLGYRWLSRGGQLLSLVTESVEQACTVTQMPSRTLGCPSVPSAGCGRLAFIPMIDSSRSEHGCPTPGFNSQQRPTDAGSLPVCLWEEESTRLPRLSPMCRWPQLWLTSFTPAQLRFSGVTNTPNWRWFKQE